MREISLMSYIQRKENVYSVDAIQRMREMSLMFLFFPGRERERERERRDVVRKKVHYPDFREAACSNMPGETSPLSVG